MSGIYNIVDIGGIINSNSAPSRAANDAAIQNFINAVSSGIIPGGAIYWDDELYINNTIIFPKPFGTGIIPLATGINFGLVGNGVSSRLIMNNPSAGMASIIIEGPPSGQFTSKQPKYYRQFCKGFRLGFTNPSAQDFNGINIVNANGPCIKLKDMYIHWAGYTGRGTGLVIQNTDGIFLNNITTAYNAVNTYIDNSNDIEFYHFENRDAFGTGLLLSNIIDADGWIELENCQSWGGHFNNCQKMNLSVWFEGNRLFPLDPLSNTVPFLDLTKRRNCFLNRWVGQTAEENRKGFDSDAVSNILDVEPTNYSQNPLVGYPHPTLDPIGAPTTPSQLSGQVNVGGVGADGNLYKYWISPNTTMFVIETGAFNRIGYFGGQFGITFDEYNGFFSNPQYPFQRQAATSGAWYELQLIISGSPDTLDWIRTARDTIISGNAGWFRAAQRFDTLVSVNTMVDKDGPVFIRTMEKYNVGFTPQDNKLQPYIDFSLMPSGYGPPQRLTFYVTNPQARLLPTSGEIPSLDYSQWIYGIESPFSGPGTSYNFVYTKEGQVLIVTNSQGNILQTIRRGYNNPIDIDGIDRKYGTRFKKPHR